MDKFKPKLKIQSEGFKKHKDNQAILNQKRDKILGMDIEQLENQTKDLKSEENNLLNGHDIDNDDENSISISHQTLEYEESELKRMLKSVSKTVAFARGGEHLARIFFWNGGESYKPEFHLHLKKEPKKIRNVANCDLVSFVSVFLLINFDD